MHIPNIKILTLVGCFCFLIPPLIAQNVDEDEDGIPDNLEQALAIKYAPEWRFCKQTAYPSIESSNQNEDFEDNYPSSVEYLVYGNQNTGDGLPQLRLKVNANGVDHYSYTDFDNINSIYTSSLTSFGVIPPVTILSSEILCDGIPYEVCLSYKNNLKGEPHDFPTYFNCRKTKNEDFIAITYFLFSAFDDKHECAPWWDPFHGCEIGDHRGDWEYFTIFIDIQSIDFSSGDINHSTPAWLAFAQHGGPKQKLSACSNRVRWVNGTHPKVYVARTSHAIYPEPGILFDFNVNHSAEFWLDWAVDFDVYDDIFLGNGLIVQSWKRNKIINMGGVEKSMDDTPWFDFKGSWGCDGSIKGPYCKLENYKLDNLEIPTWDEDWISTGPNGHKKYWSSGTSFPGLYLDCDLKFSTDYDPDPGYNCTQVVDCRRTCYHNGDIFSEVGSDVHVWGSLLQAANNLPNTQPWQVCIMPCHYPEPVVVSKAMTLKAVEGAVILGKSEEMPNPNCFNNRKEEASRDYAVPKLTVQNNGIFIFPNPTTSWVQWIDEFDEYVSVLSPNGQILMTSNKTNRIDLSHLPGGIYFLHFQDDKGASRYARVIKK